MARKEALLRLHERLVIQRDELRRKLSSMESVISDDTGGDVGDMAFHDAEKELESQLVSLESRELLRMEKAIQAIRNGTYGRCEHCQNQIPVARLQALPHTSCCIECQRKFENLGTGRMDRLDRDWESAWEFQSSTADQDLTIHDLHLDTD